MDYRSLVTLGVGMGEVGGSPERLPKEGGGLKLDLGGLRGHAMREWK